MTGTLNANRASRLRRRSYNSLADCRIAVSCNPPITLADGPPQVGGSSLLPSSVKVTRTLITLPLSMTGSCKVELVAPSISVSLLDSH